MGNETGWVKLHRQIIYNPVFRDPIRFRAWVYLICKVNHKKERFLIHGNYIWIEKGQTVTSLRQLSSIWECNVRTVKKILDQFQIEGMIKYEIPSGLYTLITVVKYEFYQGDGNIECNTEYNSECNSEYNTECNIECIQTRMNKNDKKKKNEKNKDTIGDFNEDLFNRLWDLYPRKMGKASVSKKAKQEIAKIGFERMAEAIQKYKRQIDREGTKEEYVMYGSTFFNTRYADFLEPEKPIVTEKPKEQPPEKEERELTDDEWAALP